jgi:hypothetical protein
MTAHAVGVIADSRAVPEGDKLSYTNPPVELTNRTAGPKLLRGLPTSGMVAAGGVGDGVCGTVIIQAPQQNAARYRLGAATRFEVVGVEDRPGHVNLGHLPCWW